MAGIDAVENRFLKFESLPLRQRKNPVTMPVTGFSFMPKWGFDHSFDHKRGY